MSGDGRVRIVVDDTACLVPDVAKRLDITVVRVGHDIDEDGPRTSAIGQLPLCAAYARALERSSFAGRDGEPGGDAGVVALHLSKGLSSTWSNAVTAAAALERVEVIDTNTIGAGVGAAAIAAAKAAREGAPLEQVAQVAREVLERYRVWFFVPKIDLLRKGGRISAGQAVLSTALAIRPIVGIKDGALTLVSKSRTEAKVKQRMVDYATTVAGHSGDGQRPTHILIHHANALDDATTLQSMLAQELPENTRFRILPMPDSLVAHTGTGAYAVGVIAGGFPPEHAVDFHTELGAQTLPTPQPIPGDDASSAESASPKLRSVVTDPQGTTLFTTVASKLPTWSENRRAALEKADQLAKAIAELGRRDKSDPEGATFAAGEAPVAEPTVPPVASAYEALAESEAEGDSSGASDIDAASEADAAWGDTPQSTPDSDLGAN